MDFAIRQIAEGESKICADIMRSLPQWFGIESAIPKFVKDLESTDTYIAENDGLTLGFINMNQHNNYTAEIEIIAVRPEFRRRGVGRALIEFAERECLKRGLEYLFLKTLGPSSPDWNYAQTRVFYEAMGYRPLEENGLWGESNPCLIMVKCLKCSCRSGSEILTT